MLDGSQQDRYFGVDVKNLTLVVPSYLVNTYKLDDYWYNAKEIKGFDTGELDSWTIYRPLVLGARDRFEGTPDMALRGGGSLKVNGEAAMTFHNLYTETNVNDLDYTTSLLSNCENLSIQGTYRHGYYVQGNTWYFVSLPFDIRVSDIELPAGAQKAVRYYDGAQRAANGAGNSWKNYAEDDVITVGTGFILQTNKGGWLYFPSLEGETKQYVVAYKEFAKALQEALAGDGPAWIVCPIDKDERVLPMIPNGMTVRDMIIDSKVSLTAYAAYANAADDPARAVALKEHILSVRKHIDELSAKDYSAYDAKAPDFVMMFMPSEPAYLLVLQEAPELWNEAYAKKVVLMSPTNLITALRLALDLWKREYQAQNVQKIVDRGTRLYEKVVTFTETFSAVGTSLSRAQEQYERAFGQLKDGRGSVVSQVEQLRRLGLNPKKRIAPAFRPEEEADADFIGP